LGRPGASLMRLDTLTSAETPEGIALALRPAGVVARAGAFAVDLLIRGALMLVVSMVLSPLGRFGSGLALILWFALEWFYPVLFELLPSGATPGKRAFGLRVTMDSGLPITPAASLLRNLLRSADFLPFAYGLGLATVLMRSDFKRLGDIAAGTIVVHVQRATLHGALPEATPAAPAHPLTPRAQAAVIAWAGRSTRITEARLAELAQLAAPATGVDSSSRDAVLRLLSVANWLMGKR
jgi:uncharacterized RDD family membrane protein YckC